MPQTFKNQFPGNQYSVFTRLKTVKFMKYIPIQRFFPEVFPPTRKLMFSEEKSVNLLIFKNPKMYFLK